MFFGLSPRHTGLIFAISAKVRPKFRQVSEYLAAAMGLFCISRDWVISNRDTPENEDSSICLIIKVQQNFQNG
jgi:hypothetical protein